VRIHGLLKAEKLVLSDEAAKIGNKFVKAITEESIANLQLQRQIRSIGSRQYIITLSEEEANELSETYELRPRFEKKVASEE
jgi:hypothetical protein